MTKKVRHVLGISGGKDSAALAIYLKQRHPSLDIEYYTCDTGKELEETYQLVKRLEGYLGKEIVRLKAAPNSHQDPFDHFLEKKGGYLPSSNIRWCTRALKLDPFEQWVGDAQVVSYVGIRGDEEREGYISTRANIQSIFPFRRNIWSEDVIAKALANDRREQMLDLSSGAFLGERAARFLEVLGRPVEPDFGRAQKLLSLLDLDTMGFNRLVFAFLKTTGYPLAQEADFPLLDNDESLDREDIFKLLRESGVGVPDYYEKLPVQAGGQKGHYARSRSGCYFCFFQQRIEWVWLLERHPGLFKKAMEYEKDGYAWSNKESLTELSRPERVEQIKREHLAAEAGKAIKKAASSPYLIDKIEEEEEEGCLACFL